MMGTKERAFGPLPPVTLEDLVPPDHFYRHLERSLDLGFVRDLVRDAYADSGRPSIDPVVFFKLQLILFFEGLRSERQLHAGRRRPAQPALVSRLRPDRAAARPLQPDPHPGALRTGRSSAASSRRSSSSASRAGLVWGKELYIDATKVAANAALDSLAAPLRRRGAPRPPLRRRGRRRRRGRPDWRSGRDRRRRAGAVAGRR